MLKKNSNSNNRLISSLTLTIGSLIFTWCILEIGLRILGFSYPTFYRVNEHTGVEHFPGAEGWSRIEGETYIRINSAGMRGSEIEKIKPDNVFRVAVLGDSAAEAFQVDMENNFLRIAEKKINACKAFGNKRVEILNFAVGDYGTANELIKLRQQVWLYNPDLVLLIFSGNDSRNNSKILEPQKMRPFFTVKNDALVLDNSFAHTKEFKSKNNALWKGALYLSKFSRTVQLLNKARHRLGSTQVAKNKINTQGQVLQDAIFPGPQDDAWKEAWEVTDKLILQMNKEVKDKGAKFAIASLSIAIQIDPSLEVRKKYMEKLGVKNLYYPDNRIKALAEKNKIPHIILVSQLADYALKKKTYLHGFENLGMGIGHWNEAGHLVGGNLISEKICKGNFL
jgi:hypothetical protein